MGRKRRIGIAALLCAAAVICTCGIAKADTGSIQETELEAYIVKGLSANNIPGMGISIVSAENELYCAAYGTAQDTESDYVLGSLTKSLTAAAVLYMVEEEDLSLTDTVGDYLTGYDDAVASVTVQELLNQTSGIEAYETMDALTADGVRGIYCDANANYNLLGDIIEAVTGIYYEEYLSDNILDALGMTSTYSMRMDGGLSAGLLCGYQSIFGFPMQKSYTYDAAENWSRIPSGGMVSDAKDMGNYLQMFLNSDNTVLSASSLQAMLYGDGSVAVEDGTGVLFDGAATYGMGFIRQEYQGETVLYNVGMAEGFTTMLFLVPSEDLGICMLFPLQDPLVGQELMEELARGILSLELGQEVQEVKEGVYLVRHGILDGVMLFVVLAAWMPIFLLGVWSKRRRKKCIPVAAAVKDILLHILLPTVLLLYMRYGIQTEFARRYVSDLFYVCVGVIATLYLGAVLKAVTGVWIAVKGPDFETDQDNTPEPEADAKKEEQEAAAAAESAQKEEVPSGAPTAEASKEEQEESSEDEVTKEGKGEAPTAEVPKEEQKEASADEAPKTAEERSGE